MPPFHRQPIASRRARKGIIRAVALLTGFAAALALSACGDTQVAGTSSGVDNPSLTVSFSDLSGTAMRVTGDLDVYSTNQNPAVDPEPLVTLKLKNSAFTNLTGDDFARLRQSVAKRGAKALPKHAAGGGSAVSGADSIAIDFNLVFKSQDRTGNLVIGLKYDSSARKFSGQGNSALTRLDLQPKALVRYAAKIAVDSLGDEHAGRVFVPGSPFLATLVEGSFIIEDMPEGLFPMRLIAPDGKVYAFGDSLDTKDSTRLYHALGTPVGVIDTTGGKDSLPDFTVAAGADQQAVLELTSFLEARVAGVAHTDPRLTCLWRQIQETGEAESGAPLPPPSEDTGGSPPPNTHDGRKAEIKSPTALRSEVRFPAEGVYSFEIACTYGLRVRLDTIVFSVRKLPPPAKPRIIQPRPGDSLVAEHAYNVQWEMPDAGKGLVKVQVSLNNGETWTELAEHYPGKDGLPIFPWTPARTLGISAHCLIQVTSDADSTLHARMDGAFYLIQ
ncbi:MAG: hypothetical protein ABI036_01330 [Fibrobacteria bacterium]